MASVLNVVANIQADVSKYIDGMQAATNATEAMNNASGEATAGINKNAEASGHLHESSNRLAKGLRIVAGAMAAIGAVDFLHKAIASANSFEAEFEGVNQAFGIGAKVVQDYAKNAAYTAGVSEVAALRSAKSFGVFATSAGLAGVEAGKFATQMVQAAGDLGSFYDLPTEQALGAIAAGLRGESEPLRRFNILLGDAELKSASMAAGLGTNTNALSQQQKIMLRSQIIMKGLGVAQGDFVKYADTYGNSIKTVGALFQNLQKDVGGALLPSLAKLSGALVPIIVQLGPLLTDAVKSLIPLIQAVSSVIQGLIPVFAPVLRLVGELAQKFADMVSAVLPSFIQVLNIAIPVLVNLVEAFLPLIDNVLPLLTSLLTDVVVPAMQIVADVVKRFSPYWVDLAKVILGIVIPALGILIQMWATVIQIVGMVWDAFQPLISSFLTLFSNETSSAMTTWGSTSKDAMGKFADAMDAVKVAVQKALDFLAPFIYITKAIIDSADKVKKGAATAWRIFASALDDVRKSLQKALVIMFPFLGMVAQLIAHLGGLGTVSKNALGFFSIAVDGVKKSVQGAVTWLQPFFGILAKILGIDMSKINAQILAAKNMRSLDNRNAPGSNVESSTVPVGAFDYNTDYINKLLSSANGLNSVANAHGKAAASAKTHANAVASTKLEYRDLLAAMKPFLTVEEQLGKFEQQVVDNFANLNAKISQNVTDGLISKSNGDKLKAFAKIYQDAMRNIAKQRDDLAAQMNSALDQKKAIDSFANSVSDLQAAIAPLPMFSKSLGQFESAVVSAFDSINQKIAEGINANIFTPAQAAKLVSSSKLVQAQLADIAQQRDVLAQKYADYSALLNKALDFRTNVRSNINALADVTKYGKETLQTYTQIIKGIEVTISNNVIGSSAEDIITNLQDVVKKATDFKNVLNELAKAGLNKTAYMQIVNAGVEVGKATADALIAGGPNAINTVNDLFSQLDSVAVASSDQTTTYMYDGGINTIQGFMDGIAKQDTALMNQASIIGANFTSTFQSVIDAAKVDNAKLIASLAAWQSQLESEAQLLASAFATAFQKAISDALAGKTLDLKVPDLKTLAPDIKVPSLPTAPTVPTVESLMAAGSTHSEALAAMRAWNNMQSATDSSSVVVPSGLTGPSNSGKATEYNVTVNAGLGTDGNALGATLVDIFKKYERTNGAVWQSV